MSEVMADRFLIKHKKDVIFNKYRENMDKDLANIKFDDESKKEENIKIIKNAHETLLDTVGTKNDIDETRGLALREIKNALPDGLDTVVNWLTSKKNPKLPSTVPKGELADCLKYVNYIDKFDGDSELAMMKLSTATYFLS